LTGSDFFRSFWQVFRQGLIGAASPTRLTTLIIHVIMMPRKLPHMKRLSYISSRTMGVIVGASEGFRVMGYQSFLDQRWKGIDSLVSVGNCIGTCLSRAKCGVHFNCTFAAMYISLTSRCWNYIEGRTESTEVTVSPVLSGSTKIAETAPSFTH
jgi:hypothetical protein